ncbi:MAG TPA: ribonuclease HII [Anaerolineae bacterium]|nr:ribonuclease HII [Anaerolineae bacterium]HPL30285.1 ribonuclease HII [Anaerolineae bacterium]
MRPTLAAEQAARAQGFELIAGVDEAGRGCLAGPVVAAAVVLPLAEPGPIARLAAVQDSKLLTAARRQALLAEIEATAVAIGVGVAPSWEIDRHGIVPATRRAMLRAVCALEPAARFLLIDYVRLPESLLPQRAIVKGDRDCLSIAAASIVAKVVRDGWMSMLDRAYPGYGFAAHKGYLTGAHQRALAELGPCPIHRRSFAPLRYLAPPPVHT